MELTGTLASMMLFLTPGIRADRKRVRRHTAGDRYFAGGCAGFCAGNPNGQRPHVQRQHPIDFDGSGGQCGVPVGVGFFGAMCCKRSWPFPVFPVYTPNCGCKLFVRLCSKPCGGRLFSLCRSIRPCYPCRGPWPLQPMPLRSKRCACR